uniref:RRM domain-containing protein n=1 Tax=Peronospora matthiolae TaxID=2874970 RepID=A0AAV1V5M8_9STRA
MASIFVRNLPFGVTQEELEKVFSDVGPVKKIDIIKDKGKRRDEILTRGFAFVKFAVESDAAVAIETLNKADFQGRKMLIDYAMEKGKRKGLVKSVAAEKPKQEEESEKERLQAEEDGHMQETQVETDMANKDRGSAKEKERRIAKSAKKVQGNVNKAPAAVESVETANSAKKDKAPTAVKLVETTKPVKIKQNVDVDVEPVLEDSTVAKPSTLTTTHAQSVRNARRREHRELLRNVERRREEQASVEDKSVLIFGLGANVTQKHVHKKVKKIGAVDKVELKEEARTGKVYAFVQFKSTKDAALAVTKLDRHIFKGSTLQVKSAAKAVIADGKERAGTPGRIKRAAEAEGLRLIARNLAFQTTDEDLEKLFEVYGPLFEARVVRMPVEVDKLESEETGKDANKAEPVLGRSRGFGFVQYRDVADARVAVEKLNGVKVKGREMIVDFALSKTKYLEQQKKQEEEALAASALEGDEQEVEVNSGDEDDGQLEMDADDEVDDGSNDLNDDDDEEEEEEHEEPVSLTPKEDTEAQRERTLFIRNLSFQTTEDGLRDFFQTFGAVEYARIVYEKGSELSKGVAFVRFKSADVAAEVLKRGEQPQVDSKQKLKKDRKKENMFTLSTLADGGADVLTLDGRQLILSRAVSKTDAERMADVNALERRRLDKRNLYLAYEGTINVNKMADAELELPKMDIDKRRRAIREKKLKLQNPMYFVSPLRLSVRNLSTTLDDRALKKLFHDAASAGMRAGNVHRSEIKSELLSKEANPSVKVRMAKVVRDMESVKAGKDPRSRGYGFVEFSEHLHALAALRILNNNPKYTSYAAGRAAASGASDSSMSRLIVEFALENHSKLKLREKRAADAAKKREEERALKEAQGEDGEDAEKIKKSRGQRQRESKKLRAQGKVIAKAEGDGKKTKPKWAREEVKKVKQQQPKKRKRAEAPRGDAADDALASLESAHVMKKSHSLSRSQRKTTKENKKEKSFEQLVQSYKKEIFGEKRTAGGGKSLVDESIKSADRWFQ